MTRGDRLLLLSLAAAALVVAVLVASLGLPADVLHFAPVVLIMVLLAAGRFPGERLLGRCLGSELPSRPRRIGRRWPRNGAPNPHRLVLSWDLSVRPPPCRFVVHH